MSKEINRGVRYKLSENEQFEVESIPGSLKMSVCDYLAPLSSSNHINSIVEVQFKNTHREYYVNPDALDVKVGDIVVVESQPGMDIGVVTMEEELVRKKIRNSNQHKNVEEGLKKLLRRPNYYDIERWHEAISLEQSTMIRSRQIAASLGLDMKIGDVEYQADKQKAIFYYIADGRVDFRELIKVLAEQFRLRVEMKQIGARQEAGRIGGIGSCGRELCCSSWQTCFSSVSINAARIQDITPNPQKLAGQCGKLKCCLNFETDVYDDARKSMPQTKQPLESMDGLYYFVKADVLRKIMWFSPDAQNQQILIPLSFQDVEKIQEMNRNGSKPDTLSASVSFMSTEQKEEPTFENVVGQDSLTRFDKNKSKGNKFQNRKSPQQSKPKNEVAPAAKTQEHVQQSANGVKKNSGKKKFSRNFNKSKNKSQNQ